jgi:hypothetical protein
MTLNWHSSTRTYLTAVCPRKTQHYSDQSQSAAWEKEIEKEFGINSRTSPLASSKRLDSGERSRTGRYCTLS